MREMARRLTLMR